MSDANAFDIDALLTPAAFAHPVEAIALRQTHVSWIVLTGPYAYKIKKPVRLDFLDASTLERRRFLCEEELRLNRRFAAELYVDVVPIVRTEAGLRVDGAGEPIEYAVRMKQFRADDELASLLERDAVSVAEIMALARLLADFHAGAPHASADTAPARIIDTLLANVTGLEAAAQRIAARADTAELATWMRQRVARDRALIEERARQGWIRECHGDLHAGNVVRYRERLLPFDCLEFDADMRRIDVIDDLAFLVMDIASRGCEDLAFTLLNSYLECTGDYPGLGLLALYATHRALVRAKVDALSAEAVPDRRSEFAQRFQMRLHAARTWARERRPMLVLMHGASGSGKSWLAERLVPQLPALRIRSDVERKRLAGLSADQRAADRVQGGIYSPQFTKRTYARLRELAASCLASGLTTIIDATFLNADERSAFLALAHRLAVPTAIVACSAPPDVLAERIRARARAGDRTSDADLAVLEAQLESLEPFGPDEAALLIRADTSDANVIEHTVRALRARTG